ncbi:hypothetical protein UCDDA912_g00916 [Diaporthe ampelina]|uniref:BTB domain-containing protein n=1 Tax=Diaporthe ampelina TaxID=1214573 RepID=A0A0G2FYR8_9PEZI|nr:hypothetical protein UCDDA912_g00916 [Diaporthe ampelina]
MAESTPLSIRSSLWGEERFSDANIIMGQKIWRVHRCVICQQSKYFEKALEGNFMESKTKTIDLTGSQFLEEHVDGMLKYLYIRELDKSQKSDPIAAFLVADYFQVAPLRIKAAEQLNKGLKDLTSKKFFVNFKRYCHIVLGQHPGTPLEQAVIKVISDNLQMVMHDSGAWDELTDAYPSLGTKILNMIYAKPAPPVTNIKRPVGVAFDDTLQSGRSTPKGRGFRPGSNH